MPHLEVLLDGNSIADEDARAVARVLVQSRLSQPTLCEITCHEPSGAWGRRPTRTIGSELRVVANDRTLFDGEITVAEFRQGPGGERTLHVRAYDKLHRLRKQQSVGARVQLSASALAEELAGPIGARVNASEDGPVRSRTIQHGQSDLRMLREYCEDAGLYFQLTAGTLRLFALDGYGSAIDLELGANLFECEFRLSAEAHRDGVQTAAWDPHNAVQHRETADRARAPASAAGVDAYPSARRLVGGVALDDRNAMARAQAELDRHAARARTFEGVTEGNPALAPGVRVNVAGAGDDWSGAYVVASVDHTIDRERGFLTTVGTEPPAPECRNTGTTTALGTVTSVDDPEGCGRVRVSLPIYDDAETDWLGVLVPGAGDDKGLIVMPDVGDSVLVLFAGGDPADSVVLGGLYGERSPPDTGVDGGAVRRYTFVTPGGQRVVLDDEEKTVRLENSDDSFVELTPGKCRVHSSRDLTIEAPGKKLTLRASRIDMEQG
ncbi:MAG: phage baseplate assembly protein V [Planctomycetota bacterium]